MEVKGQHVVGSLFLGVNETVKIRRHLWNGREIVPFF